MDKVIIIGNSTDLYYHDNKIPHNGVYWLGQVQDSDNIFKIFNIDNLSNIEKQNLQEKVNANFHIIALGNSLSKLNNIKNIKSQNTTVIKGKNKYETNKLLQNYININILPDVIRNDTIVDDKITIKSPGVPDMVIKPPQFTDPEPKFNEPKPVINSIIKEIHKYEYYFGINKIDIKNVKYNKNTCFVSKLYSVYDNTEYIEIDTSYFADINSSIEYYIIDDNKEIPIIPCKDKMISNEKIFNNLLPRFIIDKNKPYKIYKNSLPIDISIEEAITKNDDIYTISYYPLDGYKYKPINKEIRIKAILRVYNDSGKIPYINNIFIKQYGGDFGWQDKY